MYLFRSCSTTAGSVRCAAFFQCSVSMVPLDSTSRFVIQTLIYYSCLRYLAHQFEEDWDQFREEIVPWFPPTEHQSCALNLNQIKNSIWKLMDYDCRVSKDLCDEVSI